MLVNQLSKIKKPSFISFANFYGVNIPSMICFKSQYQVTETTTMMSWHTELGRDTNSGLLWAGSNTPLLLFSLSRWCIRDSKTLHGMPSLLEQLHCFKNKGKNSHKNKPRGISLLRLINISPCIHLWNLDFFIFLCCYLWVLTLPP